MFIENIFTTLAASAFSPAEWMGLPENYSYHGGDVGHMIDLITWFMIFLYLPFQIQTEEQPKSIVPWCTKSRIISP